MKLRIRARKRVHVGDRHLFAGDEMVCPADKVPGDVLNDLWDKGLITFHSEEGDVVKPPPRTEVDARTVIRALRKRPDLLYEVQRQIGKEVILGPWGEIPRHQIPGNAAETAWTRIRVGTADRYITVFKSSEPGEGHIITTTVTARTDFPHLPTVTKVEPRLTRDDALEQADQMLATAGALFMPDAKVPP